CRAGDGQMLTLDQSEVSLDLGALHQGNEAEPALACQQVELRRDVVATDHIEDRIDAAAASELLTDLQKVLGAIIDRNIGSIIEAGLAFLVGACGGQHLGAERLGELNRSDADAARAALHEKNLSCLQM